MLGPADIERAMSLAGAQMKPLAVDCLVNPQDGVAFTVPAIWRKRNAVDLTAGTGQDQTIVLIVAKDWDALFPARPPERGDQITYPDAGRRARVDSVIAPELGAVKTIYRLLING